MRRIDTVPGWTALFLAVLSVDGAHADASTAQRRLLGSGPTPPPTPVCSFSTTETSGGDACANIADTQCRVLCEFYYTAGGCFSSSLA